MSWDVIDAEEVRRGALIGKGREWMGCQQWEKLVPLALTITSRSLRQRDSSSWGH